MRISMRSKAFKLRRYSLLFIVVFTVTGGEAFAQGGASHFAPDSGSYTPKWMVSSWKWIAKNVGGDLFVTYEIYGFNFDTFSPPTSGGGPGIEIRIHPVFVGSYAGFCGNEGISGPKGTFSFAALYAGVIVGGYRFEAGEILGDNSAWTAMEVPRQTYTSAFIGLSKRVGLCLFLEPDVKLVFPIISHYWKGDYGHGFVPAVGHYQLRDLFFSIGLKLGVGSN